VWSQQSKEVFIKSGLIIWCTRFEVIIVVVQVGAVKI
jgi:hypothetical protein